jgi:hypothetical protein
MNAAQIIADLASRGISLAAEADGLAIDAPKGALTPADLDRLRVLKPHLLAYLRERRTADRTLALLNRLKTYTLPTGKMPAARALAERLRPLVEADTETILSALEIFERELIKLGARPDLELLEAVEMVEGTFPGARLVEV